VIRVILALRELRARLGRLGLRGLRVQSGLRVRLELRVIRGM
jgi:hypothetical protein